MTIFWAYGFSEVFFKIMQLIKFYFRSRFGDRNENGFSLVFKFYLKLKFDENH